MRKAHHIKHQSTITQYSHNNPIQSNKMKFFLTFVCVVFYIDSSNAAIIPPEIQETIMEVLNACIKQVPDVDPVHLAKLKKHEFVEGDENLKQIVKCFQVNSKEMNDDGTFNVNILKEHLANIMGNNDHDKEVDECVNVDQHEATERAWAFAKCMYPKIGELE